VLQRWDREAKQDPEGEGERVYTWKALRGRSDRSDNELWDWERRKKAWICRSGNDIVATIPLTLLGERFRGKYSNEKVIQGR